MNPVKEVTCVLARVIQFGMFTVMKISVILKRIEKGDSMTLNATKTTLKGFGNTEFDFTHSDGLFSSASIQRRKILLEQLGNADLITYSVLWYLFCAKSKISIVDMRNDMQITATRMTRACKTLINLKIVNNFFTYQTFSLCLSLILLLQLN